MIFSKFPDKIPDFIRRRFLKKAFFYLNDFFKIARCMKSKSIFTINYFFISYFLLSIYYSVWVGLIFCSYHSE